MNVCKTFLSLSFIAVVFVVDSSHRDRVSEAHSELAKLLTEKELRDALLLIFANKQVLVIFFSLLLFSSVCLSISNILNPLLWVGNGNVERRKCRCFLYV